MSNSLPALQEAVAASKSKYENKMKFCKAKMPCADLRHRIRGVRRQPMDYLSAKDRCAAIDAVELVD